MVHYAELGHRPRWGYLPNEYHPRVVTKFECAKKNCVLISTGYRF